MHNHGISYRIFWRALERSGPHSHKHVAAWLFPGVKGDDRSGLSCPFEPFHGKEFIHLRHDPDRSLISGIKTHSLTGKNE
jgi:hypothetical protein